MSEKFKPRASIQENSLHGSLWRACLRLRPSISTVSAHWGSTKGQREEDTEEKAGTHAQRGTAALTVEDARGRVLGDHRAVLLIAVVSTVI